MNGVFQNCKYVQGVQPKPFNKMDKVYEQICTWESLSTEQPLFIGINGPQGMV
jgi:hypothetical protein